MAQRGRPRKRPATSTNDDRQKKRAKRPASNEKPTLQHRSASSVPTSRSRRASDQAIKQDIRWILPTKKVGRTTGYDREAAEAFALTLYDRPWAELRNLEHRTLEQAPIHSPILRNSRKVSQRTMNQEHDRYGSSAALRRLFKQIQADSDDDWSCGPFCIHNFASAFGDPDNEDCAVVASEGQPPIALDGNYLAETRLPQQNGNDAPSVYIQRLHAQDGSVGYFVLLPQGQTVRVNGEYYKHIGDVELATAIGPLETFVVIELAGQPILFWRRRDDTSFARPRRIELSDDGATRSTRESQSEDARIVWNRLLESEGADEDTEDEEEEGYQIDQQVFGKLTPCEYLHQHLNKFEEEIRVARIESGPIQMIFLPRLIRSVLLAVNDRQLDDGGFSVPVEGFMLRPGRPYIFPLWTKAQAALLIAQFTEGQKIGLYAMHPMEWRSEKEHRQALYKSALDTVLSEGWLYKIRFVVDDILAALPREALYVDSAQATDTRGSLVYTVLNAWALALGLRPDPNFGLVASDTTSSRFFDDAHSLFYLVLSRHHVDWRVLLAFFKCYKFTLDDDSLPAIDRRFSMYKKIPLANVVQKEKERDQAWRQRAESRDIASLADNVGSHFESGRPHNEAFRSDVQTDEFKSKVVKTLIEHDQWHRTFSDEQLQQIYHAKHSPSSPLSTPPSSRRSSSRKSSSRRSSSRKSSASSTATSPLTRDVSHVPPLFDFCEYFGRTIDELLAEREPQLNDLPPQLSSKEIFDSIAAVTQAIDHVQTPSRGFGLMDYDTLTSFVSGEKEHPEAPATTDPRLLFLPWTRNGHTILFVAQKDPEASVLIHAFDSAPWLTGLSQRVRLHHTIMSLLKYRSWNVDLEHPDAETRAETSWSGSYIEASDAWHTSYYAIMTVWALALGQSLNTSFRPSETFFGEARVLIQAVLNGLADWKLIWAFLRCTGFVFSGTVDVNDRFTRTVASSDLDRHRARLTRRLEKFGIPSLNEMRFLTLPQGLAHSKRIPSDDWKPEHRTGIARHLIKAGVSVSDLNATELVEAFHVQQKKPSLSTSDNDLPEPCRYLREKMDEALSDPYVLDNLDKVEASPAKRWMSAEEVAQAIASVTLAISTIQAVESGYGFVHPDDVAICESPEDYISIAEAIRPGRPTVVPFTHGSHTVLIIIQIDVKGSPEISVLDSRPYHFKLEERSTVYSTAVRILQRSNWWRAHFKVLEDVPVPESATWISGAIQTVDWSCGYHAIFQAWALLLGLELNSGFEGDWDTNSPLFCDTQNIIRLARIGAVDWKLILAFLRCYEIVNPNRSVEGLRKFSNTMRVLNLKSLEQILAHLLESEQRALTGEEQSSDRSVRNENRIQLPEGKPHNIRKACDEWNEMAQLEDGTLVLDCIHDLIRLGRLNVDFSTEQLQEEYYNFFPDTSKTALEERFNAFFKKFKSIKKGGSIMWDPLVEALHKHLGLVDASKHNLHQERIGKTPCIWWKQYARTYRILRKTVPMKDVAELPAFGEILDDWQVALSIATVVEAIDRKQASKREDELFTGGFSLTNATSIARGMSSTSFNDDADVVVSRPRRCWLMPIVVASSILEEVNEHIANKIGSEMMPPEEGHIILSVLQEEPNDEGETNFRVYLLDSLPSYLENAYGFLYDKIIKTAQDLRWSTPRQDEEQVLFETDPYLVHVPYQKNDWACGYHTIINAWILALGLTPNPYKKYDNKLYKSIYEIVDLALAGVLDWRTLTAWLFCNELTLERSVDRVQLDRRFAVTLRQHRDDELGFSVAEARELEDAIMESLGGDFPDPYDRSNNVDFWTEGWTVLDHQGDDEEEEEDLQRAFDDVDVWEDSDDTGNFAKSARRQKTSRHRYARGFDSESADVAMSTDDEGLDFLDDIPDPGRRVSLLYS